MDILLNDVLRYADITNAGGIITANGHPIQYVQDTRLSRSAWIVPEGLQGNLYGISMYKETPYVNAYAIDEVIIDFDIGGSVPFDTFTLAGNNWNNINIELSWANADINSPDGSVIYSSLTPEYVFFVPLGAQIARYFRLRLFSITTDGNYISIGRLALGTSKTVPKISDSLDLEYISNATKKVSDSRQLYGGPKVVYRSISLNFPEIEDPSVILDWFRQVDIYQPLFVDIDEECLPEPKAFYGAIAGNSIIFTYNAAGFYTGRITFEEVF